MPTQPIDKVLWLQQRVLWLPLRWIDSSRNNKITVPFPLFTEEERDFLYQIETIFSEGTLPVRPFKTKYNQMKPMRNLFSILCTLALSFIVQAAGCSILVSGMTACTNKTRTIMQQNDSITLPKKHYSKPSDATLRKVLTPEQYAVTQHAATERPFNNAYDHEFREYIC